MVKHMTVHVFNKFVGKGLEITWGVKRPSQTLRDRTDKALTDLQCYSGLVDISCCQLILSPIAGYK